MNTTPVVLFDFDGTLTTRDSLLPFLAALVGRIRLAAAIAALAPVLAGYRLGRVPNDVAKQRLLARTLGGRLESELRRAGAAFAASRLPGLLSARGMELLAEHQRAGHECVLASASLDLYLAPWAERAGFVHCAASSLAVDEDGRVSGALRGGNCFGEEKRRRLQSWLAGRRPAAVFAYSDSAHDKPMLGLADEAFIISAGRLLRVGHN